MIYHVHASGLMYDIYIHSPNVLYILGTACASHQVETLSGVCQGNLSLHIWRTYWNIQFSLQLIVGQL